MKSIRWGKAITRPTTTTPTPLSVGVATLSGVPLPVVSRTGRGSGFSDLPPEDIGNKVR